jgi:hypothetical protein
MARAARPEEADDEPCPVPPASAYRGLENQLYRVEVHRVEIPEGEDLPTAVEIKWSRVNGSATYPIETFGEDGKVVTLATLGRDRGLMIDVGDYVEVVDDRYVLYPGDDPLRRTTNPLLRVMDVEPLDRTVTLSATSEDVGHVASRHPFLRRWDHQAGPGRPKIGDGGALHVQLLDTEPTASGPGPKESDWVDLEDGVQVKITQGRLRPGDYWLIPARTETGDVEWPGDPADPAALPPMGVDYAFAPLAIVRADGVVSLRKEFAPLATG